MTLKIAMNAGNHDDGDAARSERAIRSLSDASGASPEEVRDLFTVEFSRLARVAKVRKYLHVLTAANVRAMLSRARVRNGHARGSSPAAGRAAIPARCGRGYTHSM